MARPKNEKTHLSHREKLLETGERAFRETSFSGTGINEILAESGVPKGSFYHHFPSKEAFGIAVADRYNEAQLAAAKTCLQDASLPPIDRLRAFFEGARTDMGSRKFQQGCLMCNLSTEFADEKPAFQTALDAHWRALTAVLEDCLAKADLSELGLHHLTPAQAADWLLNSWSGALTRMKVCGTDEPLALFMQTVFRPKDLKT